MLPTIIVTTGGVTMLMAFMTFGKRRRDDDMSGRDDTLGDAAARGIGIFGHSRLVPGPRQEPAPLEPSIAQVAAVEAAVQATMVPAGTLEAEVGIPRWRRPSLMAARKTDPLRTASTIAKLSFDGDAVAAANGMERRLVRYRFVSLLDAPDEVRGSEIGIVDEGDEIVLLEKRGTFCRVLCPDGREGWLHKMTLGDVVADTTGAAGRTGVDEVQTVGGFDEVMRAYAERRQRFGEA